jgi:hypothetical protein
LSIKTKIIGVYIFENMTLRPEVVEGGYRSTLFGRMFNLKRKSSGKKKKYEYVRKINKKPGGGRDKVTKGM